MSLLAQPGVTTKDIVTIQPVAWQVDPRGEDWGKEWVLKGRPLKAISKRLSSSELFNTGKTDLTIAYNLYVEIPRSYTPGVSTPPVVEKDRIWHPEGSKRNSDGTLDYETSMEVRNTQPYPNEGIFQIDCQRTF